MTTLVCKCEGYTYITYEDYCLCVEEIIAEKKLMNSAEKNKFKQILNFLKIFKDKLALHLKQMGIAFKDLIIAMLKRDFYNILHLLKFNIHQLLQALGSIQRLISNGILKILSEIAARSKTIKNNRERLQIIDEFLNKYPILKYLAGPALAGLLFWMWMNIAFLGNFDSDFDLKYIADALVGKFTVYDLFGSEQGLSMVIMFFAGLMQIFTFNWFIAAPFVVPIAIIYSFSKHTKLGKLIKSWIEKNCKKTASAIYDYVSINESEKIILMNKSTDAKFNINEFITNLNLKNWFLRLGKTEIAISTNLKYINSLENALLVWSNNSENRKDEWEKLRVKLLKNEIWSTEFDNIKKLTYNELKKNGQFIQFTRNIKTIYNKLNKNDNFAVMLKDIIDPEILASQLPIIGYFGETLVNTNTNKYYTKEIEYFQKGHFVVEHIGNKFLIY